MRNNQGKAQLNAAAAVATANVTGATAVEEF